MAVQKEEIGETKVRVSSNRDSFKGLNLNPQLSRQFLESLFSRYYSQACEPSYLEIRGRKENDPPGKLTFRRFFLSINALLKDMNTWEPDLNYWVGVALRQDMRGGKKENLVALTALFADQDYGQEGHKKKNKWQTRGEALAAIQFFPLRPSILIHSGGGFQPYWLLKEPFGLENGDYAQVEAIMKGLALGLGGDVGTQDVSRILRLPGTYNMKLADNPRPVEIVWCETKRVYSLADFAEYALAQTPQNKVDITAPTRSQTTDLEDLRIPAWTKTLILTGVKDGYPSRSERDHAVIGELFRVGCNLDTIEAIYQAHPVGEKYREKGPHGRAYLQASINKPLSMAPPKPITALETPLITSITPLWPQEVMTGAAGVFAGAYAAYLETPKPFLFMNYLTLLGHVISDKVTLKSEISPQPRLYIANLGESADTRKSTSINKTTTFFLEVIDSKEINPIWGVGSAEGLARAFDKQPRAILILDELKAIIQKMRIEASVLLPCVNTLFESNRFHSLTQKHNITIDDAELCLLSASTLDTYQNMFSPQFLNIGFVNRLFIVIGDSQRKFSIPQPMPEKEKERLRDDLNGVLRFVGDLTRGGRYAFPITPQAQKIFDGWYFRLEQSVFAKRLDTYGHRLMPLLAVNEMKDSITPEIAQRVVALLDYQLAARKYADPIDADNAIARLEEKIRRLLANGPMKKRDLEIHGHKSRVGTYLWNAAIKNLTTGQEIHFDEKAKIYRRIL